MFIMLRILVSVALFYFIYLQIVKPLTDGTQLFPLFRKGTPIKKEVSEMKEEIGDLKEKTTSLCELSELGEATKKRLIMEADGALEPKLQAAIQINARYAEAIEKAQTGAWVPNIQMGSSGTSSGGSAAANLIDLMTAKTAKDLSLDMTITQGTKAKK